VENTGGDVLIKFFGISGLDSMAKHDLPSKRETILLKALNGKLQIDNDAGEIVLRLTIDKN
jgi:hypothetical protein